MTLLEFRDKMINAFPNAQWDIDNDGQLIIYTNLQRVGDNVVTFEDEVVLDLADAIDVEVHSDDDDKGLNRYSGLCVCDEEEKRASGVID